VASDSQEQQNNGLHNINEWPSTAVKGSSWSEAGLAAFDFRSTYACDLIIPGSQKRSHY
jgi:hypothetical protein